ncbi:MAG: hypothetical protein OXC38_00780, partial [Gammaproteobacteria bacterium]|nr:hypothetical protein [Gammaproteobacteria bacterium]
APRPPGNRSDRGFIIRRKCPIYRAQTEIATPKGGLMKENLTNLTYTPYRPQTVRRGGRKPEMGVRTEAFEDENGWYVRKF